jgi:nickel-dependent lactate racemase
MREATRTDGSSLREPEIRDLCATEMARWNLRGKRVLLIAPDGTRTAPMGLMLRVVHGVLAAEGATLDVLVALGTHPPMSEAAIERRFEITTEDRQGWLAGTRFHNHRWDDPAALVSLGALEEEEVQAITGGAMRERVNVTINRLALEYDLLLVVGPTFPHEVAGFSGGNKYLFPGISGREIIDMFHWLGALITNPGIIGRKRTRVRAVIDRAAAMVPIPRKCVSMVVDGERLAGVFVGTPEETFDAAADLSERTHVAYADRPYRSVLSCAPPMYDELWVGGKCAYKLEPIVADGGELIIYAPHISRLSATHGEAIRRVGYHVRDYFTAQMDRFADVPRGVLAHSTHVKGVGTYEGGVERPRITVTLATGLGEAECRAIHLGYRDPRTIDPGRWRDGDDDGLLHVPLAGEILHRLRRHATGPTPGLGQ